jgi:hypothetical protein
LTVNGIVLLDTNVWRPLLDHDAAVGFRRTLKSTGRIGAISPLVFDELVETPVAATRDGLLRLAGRSSWWRRLLPICMLDAQQLVASIRLHRPDWLLPSPDLKKWHYERGAYGTTRHKSFYTNVRDYPEAYAKGSGPNDRIRRLQMETTRMAKKVGPHFDSTDVASAMTDRIGVDMPGTPMHGWSVESWRFQAANTIWNRFDTRDSGPIPAMLLACFVDRSRITPAGWLDFWANRVCPSDASREWLRCALFHLQATRKVGSGVSGDLGLVGHLVDIDTFVTFDKPFFECLERVRPAAPFPFARVVYAKDLEGLLPQLRSLPTYPQDAGDFECDPV